MPKAKSKSDSDLQKRVEQLEAEVRERDEAIASLTDYLESTTKQWEQVKRNTGFKGALFDDESLSDQLQLVGEMHRVVDEWDSAQTVLRIEHIAAEIDGLRTLIAPEAVPESVPPGFGLSYSTGNSSPDVGDDASAMARWEALKANYMSDGSDGDERAAIEESETQPSDGNQELDVLILRPGPMGEDASLEDCREAAEAREAHMISLIRTVRAMWARRRGNVNWQELTHAPEDLRTLVEQRESELHQKLRSGEVELSMERARLGREEMMLRQAQDEINKRRTRSRKRGAPQEPRKDESKDRRWLRFLGGKKES